MIGNETRRSQAERIACRTENYPAIAESHPVAGETASSYSCATTSVVIVAPALSRLFPLRAVTGPPRFPGDPSRGSASVHDPGRPLAPRLLRRFRCCPHCLNHEGVIICPSRGLPRRFVTPCLRFTTPVAARHARLGSGWRAAPLPGGSRTRWIATKGFRSFFLLSRTSLAQLNLS